MSKALGTVFVALGLAASRDCDHAGDKWLLVDPSMNAIVVANATGMPDLPPGTRSVSYGVKNSRHQGYDRTIVIAGPLSLSPSDEFYAYAKLMRHSLEIFADIVNTPSTKCVREAKDGSCTLHGLGGIQVGDQRMALYFEWAGDASNKAQVTNATLHATRGACADFTIAGYASSLTKYTAQQSFYDNRVMLAPAAAATSVYTQEINGSARNLTFGLAISLQSRLPPPPSHISQPGLEVGIRSRQLQRKRLRTVAVTFPDGKGGEREAAKYDRV